MRQYKFRFWYKKENRWLDNVRIDNNGDIYPIDANGEEDTTIDCLQVEKSQFVGLKYGEFSKEVYEGDVINFDNLIGVVSFGECVFYIKWQNGFCSNIYQLLIDEGHGEVIGNIYENPELLK